MPDRTLYRAEWIVSPTARPVRHGCLAVEQDRIVAVLESAPPSAIDLGRVAIIPGLVNAHTHLEFSELTEPLPTRRPFTAWLTDVIENRRSAGPSRSNAIQQGLQESLEAGTTLLGDIATRGWTRADYDAVPHRPAVVCFQELLGLAAERVDDWLAIAEQHLSHPDTDSRWTPALSPHAPYTVHPELLRRSLELGERTGAPVAMHLAETTAERELLTHGTGPFRDFLTARGLFSPDVFGQRSFTDLVEALSEQPRGLIIHGTDLNSGELRYLAGRPQTTLVYCPRTHAAFELPPHPWRTLLHLGGSVAIGTDSRASNPDLSVFHELQFLASQPDALPAHELLKLATVNGARALGQGRVTGDLTPGKRADAALIALDDPAFRSPLSDLFLPGNHIAGTIAAGHLSSRITSG
jgi:aminodeoxyfutalosine deaminase